MMKCLLTMMAVICLLPAGFGQKEKRLHSKLKFCGYQYRDSVMLRKHLQEQVDFLQISSGDTIVDIGSSSGAYPGAISVILPAASVHFILVDIDTACLSKERLQNMISHYQEVKGAPLPATFSRVNNTPDSLYLPIGRYSKVLLMNTLHEIRDRDHFIRQVAGVLAKGGELVISELMATDKYKVHFGCHQPLLNELTIKKELAAAGFICQAMLVNPGALPRKRNPYYFFRFVKQ